MKKLVAVSALTLLLAVSGCSSTATSAEAPEVDAAGESSAAATESAEPKADEPKRSERGNLIKVIGQGAGVSSAVSKDQLADFVINSITPDAVCTGEYAQPPVNGHFIVLDVSIKTYPALAEESWPVFDLNPYNMKIVAPNGTTSNADLATASTYGCLPDAELLPSNGIGPAESLTGKMVLDSEVAAGTLVVTNGPVGGWEYEFGTPPNA